jgi:molybdopterin converting factor small subunit
MAVAIDGEIYQSPLLEKIGAESEVHFLPPIGGG